MTPSCMHSTMKRRSSGGGVVEQRRFLLSLHACLCVFEDNDTKRQARLCETHHRESQRIYGIKQKKIKKKRVENERVGERKREGGSGIKWKVKKKKGEDGILWVYMCGGQNARVKKKKKGNVWLKERQRIRNHNLKLLPQYFHNKF